MEDLETIEIDEDVEIEEEIDGGDTNEISNENI